MKRRYSRRRPRRTRRSFYRKRRYGRKKSYKKFGKKRKNTALSKLFKALLPTVPVKACGAFGVVGSYGCRSYTTTFVGDTYGVFTGRDYLPSQSNLFDDGSVGSSTHLSFQQFGAKKFKAKHSKRILGQNLGNTHMILTVYICEPRHDFTDSYTPTVEEMFPDCLATTASGQDLLDINSSLPGSSNIDKYYKYPQFTPFHSAYFTSTFKVVKSHKLRVGPSEWFRINLGTRYKEFDKKWLVANNGLTVPVKLLRGFSKFALFSWHGEAVAKTDALTVTLCKNDLMIYYNQTWTYKAIPYHRKSTVLATPIGLHTETTIADGEYKVRPSGVVQITETSHDTKPE